MGTTTSTSKSQSHAQSAHPFLETMLRNQAKAAAVCAKQFAFLTYAEFDALTATDRAAYEAAVKKQWLVMVAEDNAINASRGVDKLCLTAVERIDHDNHADAAEEHENQFLGGGLPV